MKNINTSLFDFPTLCDPAADYIYVDRTAQSYEIAKPTADCIYYLPQDPARLFVQAKDGRAAKRTSAGVVRPAA